MNLFSNCRAFVQSEAWKALGPGKPLSTHFNALLVQGSMAQPRSCSAMKTAEAEERNALELVLGTRQDGVWSHTSQRKAA